MGTRDNRLAFGEQYGADVILNTKKDKVEEFILQDTQGNGVDVVIEAAGAASAFNSGLEVLKKGGELLLYGVLGGGASPINVQPIQMNELVIKGLNASPLRYPRTIELVSSGMISVKELISHTFRLEDLPELFSSGFIGKGDDNYMKGVVLFD